MADARPHLVPAPGAAAPPAPEEKERSRRLPWLLALLIVVCAVGWGLAQRRASQLALELGATQSALAEVSTSLRALEAQRAEARAQIEGLAADASALAERLSSVGALLATDLPPAADTQATRSEGDAAR
jgi:hypothetical protein